MRSSLINQKSEALIVRYSQKKEWISFVFYCFESPLIAHNFGTTGPIQVRFLAKCTSPNKDFNQIENHIFYCRLISLDRITYVESFIIFCTSISFRYVITLTLNWNCQCEFNSTPSLFIFERFINQYDQLH